MKSTYLKHFFFSILFLLVFQGLGRAEVGLGFEGEVTAAKNHVNNLPSTGLGLVKLTDAKAFASQTSALPPNKMVELIKVYSEGPDFVGDMNKIQGFYVKAAIDARSAGKMDDVATFYAAVEKVRKYRQLEPLKAHIDAVSDLWQDVEKLDLFISDLASNENLLDFFKAADDATRLKYAGAFEVAAKHGDDVRLNTEFLSTLSLHLDDFPNLKPDLDDIDVFNAYKQIADDVEQSYEVLDDVEGNLALLIAQKTQNSNAQPFWYWLQKGKKFESEYLLPKFKNRTSAEYVQLKNAADTEFGVNLDEFDMYSQVQLKYNANDYFVADQVYVKWGLNPNTGVDEIQDIVVVENKLKQATRLTTNQNAGKVASSLEVRSVEIDPASSVSGIKLTNQLPPITTNNKWLKVYDSENGDVISGIDKL